MLPVRIPSVRDYDEPYIKGRLYTPAGFGTVRIDLGGYGRTLGPEGGRRSRGSVDGWSDP